MSETPLRRTDELKTRYERYRRIGLGASLILHLLVFWILSIGGGPESPLAAAGPRAGDDRAAAGGGAMEALQIQQPQPQPEIIRPPEPIITPEMTIEEPETEPEMEPVEIAQFDGVAGREEGPDEGPGLEEGEGQGDGGTAERGRFRVVPPVPRGMIMPPSNKPDRVRGREVEVWVFVTQTGQVVADSTRLRPPTGDTGFDRRLKEQAAQWIFEPATRGGESVARWFQYVITL